METISLEGLEFYAFHGHYEEEQKLGNKYSIDLEINADLSEAANTDKLRDTIDYVVIYQAVKKVMEIKHRLLENIAHEIAEALSSEFKQIKKLKVSVSKYNPPIGGVCNKAKLTLEKTF